MTHYLRYIVVKAAQAALTIWLTYSLSFAAANLIPGDPISSYLTAMESSTPEAVDALRKYYAYDQSWATRYFTQLSGVLQGNFGYSLRLGKPVVDVVVDSVGSTFRLTFAAIFLALVASLGLTIVASASRRSGPLDRMVRLMPAICSALPSFWLGLVAVSLFAVHLQIMPLYPDGSLISILVPAGVLAIILLPPISEVAIQRADAISQELYVDLARVRGARPVRIFLHHVLPGIVNPVMVVTGVSMSMLLGGAVVTETIFSRNGIGVVLLDAVTANDVPLVVGFVLIIATAVTLINLAIDALQPLVDPRLLREGAAT